MELLAQKFTKNVLVYADLIRHPDGPTVTVASIPLAIKQLGFERFLSVPALTRRHQFCQMLPLAACVGAFASSVAFYASLKSLAKQPADKDCKQS